MGKTVKDLVLALLNATLILIALCLVLGLMVVNRANAITETFASNLIKLEPVKAEVVATREEIAALRADLAALQVGTGEVSSAAMQRVQTRMDGIETRFEAMQQTVQGVKSLPYDLADHAIEKTTGEIANQVGWLRGCTRADGADGTVPAPGTGT